MAEKKYPNVVRAISEHPWEILPQTLETILELVRFRAEGGTLTPEEVQARIGSSRAKRSTVVSGSVAVVPLYGVIFPRANLFTEMSGATSLELWIRDFEQAIANPQVSAVLVDVNSPGGSIFLVTETAERIRNARGQKPIVAIANTMMASAAYHLASQADEIVATPSALVGAIGVYMVHEDWSRFNEAAGVLPTYISAGKFKTEGNPDEPLGDDARQHLQSIVDDAYSIFVADIAKGRGVRASAVRSGYGEGRVVPPQLALELGMVDRIETFEQAIARLTSGGARASKPAGGSDLLGPRATGPVVPARTVELDPTLIAELRALTAETRDEIEARFERKALRAIADNQTLSRFELQALASGKRPFA